MKFQQISDCFIPKFTLKYEDSANIKTDLVDTVVFNLHKIKQRNFFGTPVGHQGMQNTPNFGLSTFFSSISLIKFIPGNG